MGPRRTDVPGSTGAKGRRSSVSEAERALGRDTSILDGFSKGGWRGPTDLPFSDIVGGVFAFRRGVMAGTCRRRFKEHPDWVCLMDDMRNCSSSSSSSSRTVLEY